MRKQHEFCVALPVNLDLEEIVAANPVPEELPKDFMMYVISLVLIKNRQACEFEGDYQPNYRFDYRYVPLCSKALRKIGGTKTTIAMDWLCQVAGILKKIDHDYTIPDSGKKGRKGNCSAYLLSEEYQFQPFKIEDIGMKIGKKVRAFHRAKLKGKILDGEYKAPEKFDYLNNWLMADEFNIDMDGALLELNRGLRLQEFNFSSYISSIISLQELNNWQIRISHNPDPETSDGRLHTNITQTPKRIRKFIKYLGGTLAELDLSNSVPFFLYSHLITLSNQQPIITNTSPYTTITTNTTPYPTTNLTYHNNQPLPPTLLKIALTVDSQELKDFGELTINGGLYRHFLDDFKGLPTGYLKSSCTSLLEQKYTGVEAQQLKLIKKSILGMMFAKTSQFKRVQEIFGLYFPTILQWMNKYKRRGKKHECKRHAKLARHLFQLEAHYMIKRIARSFNARYHSHIPIFSLHDCLVTTKENLPKLRQHMEQEFLRLIGICPRIKAKVWEGETVGVAIAA